MSEMQGIPPSDAFQDLSRNYHSGGIIQNIEDGIKALWIMVLAFLFWPLLLGLPFPGITTWEIIFIEAIWLVLVTYGIVAFRRRRR